MSASIWQFIDRDATLARLANDQALFDDLVTFFLEDHGPMMEKLGVAVTQRNAPAVERAAHSLKGLAANLGATEMSAIAATLETMGRENNLIEVGPAHDALKAELPRLVFALRAYQIERSQTQDVS